MTTTERLQMDVSLILFRADGSRRIFPVRRPVILIGRREDADFRIPLPSVSRKHCQLVLETDHLRLEDLGSANGTNVNGRRVESAVLKAGDTVTVGPVKFVLQINGRPSEAELAKPESAVSPDAKSTTLDTTTDRTSTGRSASPLNASVRSTPEAEIEEILASSDADDSSAGDVLIDFEPDSK